MTAALLLLLTESGVCHGYTAEAVTTVSAGRFLGGTAGKLASTIYVNSLHQV